MPLPKDGDKKSRRKQSQVTPAQLQEVGVICKRYKKVGLFLSARCSLLGLPRPISTASDQEVEQHAHPFELEDGIGSEYLTHLGPLSGLATAPEAGNRVETLGYLLLLTSPERGTGDSMLSIAASRGWSEVVLGFLKDGWIGNVGAKDTQGRMALTHLVEAGNGAIALELLCAGADPDVPGYLGLTARDIASKIPSASSRQKMVALFEREDDGRTSESSQVRKLESG
ncbi:hypothetical protein OQA88_9142 [Cercophora sp. LCS_1]